MTLVILYNLRGYLNVQINAAKSVCFMEMRWEVHSHVTCRYINVIYYLKCNMYDHKETYIETTVDDNVGGFKSKINQPNSDCRTGTSVFQRDGCKK